MNFIAGWICAVIGYVVSVFGLHFVYREFAADGSWLLSFAMAVPMTALVLGVWTLHVCEEGQGFLGLERGRCWQLLRRLTVFVLLPVLEHAAWLYARASGWTAVAAMLDELHYVILLTVAILYCAIRLMFHVRRPVNVEVGRTSRVNMGIFGD